MPRARRSSAVGGVGSAAGGGTAGAAAVSYGAVGASLAPDLLAFPPAGFRPTVRGAIIGHGEPRWNHAVAELLRWGVQRRSGLRVDPLDSGDRLAYSPVQFDEDGTPRTPARFDEELVFAADGAAELRAGDSVRLTVPFGPFRVGAPVRVVQLVEEPDRRGVVLGTLPGHPLAGEEAFLVERAADGTIRLEVRAFARPANPGWRLLAPALRIARTRTLRRYLTALGGPIEAGRLEAGPLETGLAGAGSRDGRERGALRREGADAVDPA